MKALLVSTIIVSLALASAITGPAFAKVKTPPPAVQADTITKVGGDGQLHSVPVATDWHSCIANGKALKFSDAETVSFCRSKFSPE